MRWISTKVQEILSNIWVKLLAVIPPCFFKFDEREKIMIVALLVSMTIDCIFGVMVARYIKDNFEWNLLGKKFSRKFVLFFLFLLASFVLSKAYAMVGWWFYVAGTLITLSEFGSLAEKAKMLGIPIDLGIIGEINLRIENTIRKIIGIREKRKK